MGVTELFVWSPLFRAEVMGVYNQLKCFYGSFIINCQKQSFITSSQVVIGHFFDTI